MSVLVTKEAPDFTAAAVLPDGSIKEDFKLSDLRKKYVVLFFYPLDFTFVCPTEIIAHNKRIDEFKKRDVEVVAVSIDSQFSHYSWRRRIDLISKLGFFFSSVYCRVCRCIHNYIWSALAYRISHTDVVSQIYFKVLIYRHFCSCINVTYYSEATI